MLATGSLLTRAPGDRHIQICHGKPRLSLAKFEDIQKWVLSLQEQARNGSIKAASNNTLRIFQNAKHRLPQHRAVRPLIAQLRAYLGDSHIASPFRVLLLLIPSLYDLGEDIGKFFLDALRIKLQNLRRIQPATYWRSLDRNYRKEGGNSDFKLFRDSDPADLDNLGDQEDISSLTELEDTAENGATSPRLRRSDLFHRAQGSRVQSGFHITATGHGYKIYAATELFDKLGHASEALQPDLVLPVTLLIQTITNEHKSVLISVDDDLSSQCRGLRSRYRTSPDQSPSRKTPRAGTAVHGVSGWRGIDLITCWGKFREYTDDKTSRPSPDRSNLSEEILLFVHKMCLPYSQCNSIATNYIVNITGDSYILILSQTTYPFHSINVDHHPTTITGVVMRALDPSLLLSFEGCAPLGAVCFSRDSHRRSLPTTTNSTSTSNLPVPL